VLCGWLGLAAGYAILGPLGTLAPTGTFAATMVLQGVASAAIVIPSLPQLQLGLSAADDDAKALICSVWNGVYSAGAAAGPLATSALCGAAGFGMTVVSLLAFSAAFAALLVAAALVSSAGSARAWDEGESICTPSLVRAANPAPASARTKLWRRLRRLRGAAVAAESSSRSRLGRPFLPEDEAVPPSGHGVHGVQ